MIIATQARTVSGVTGANEPSESPCDVTSGLTVPYNYTDFSLRFRLSRTVNNCQVAISQSRNLKCFFLPVRTVLCRSPFLS